jgi:hypothetical protein
MRTCEMDQVAPTCRQNTATRSKQMTDKVREAHGFGTSATSVESEGRRGTAK